MGTVYIGEDTQLGNRLVAIKEMGQSGLSSAERLAVARNFQHEAHLLAGLQHPNLPSIYDHFEENHRWYLVMSFINGQTLAAYLRARGGKLSAEEVLAIGTILCNVLGYLHKRQPPIIFRDLKPENIMRASDGHIYLIDFGIARFFKPGQAKDTLLHGSSGYAPPEQYGRVQTTPRSDIYSLGATLYELLSGYEPAKTPFHLPPLESLVPTVPPRLAELITRMLDMDEQKRPQSAEIVRLELQSISNDLDSTVLLPTTTKKKGKRGLLTTLAATGAALVLIIASYFAIGNLNAHSKNTSTGGSSAITTSTPFSVLNTFCRALNSSSPDFQTAYAQLSHRYQHEHSLVDFQETFQRTIHCAIASAPNAQNQAEISLTTFCMPPPPSNGPPPYGSPPPYGPPPDRQPPPSINPVDLTLIKDGSNGWRIDTIYVVGSVCGPPPDRTPTPTTSEHSAVITAFV